MKYKGPEHMVVSLYLKYKKIVIDLVPQGLLPIFCFLIIASWAFGVASLQAAYKKTYSTIANGGMTYTGNTLGLSKRNNQNRPGTEGSIGTFSTTDTSSKVDGYPFGTTLYWQDNSASAVLQLPSGSTVLYAELIWGGSYYYGGQNVSAYLNSPITFITPSGTYSVSPSATTAATLTNNMYVYVRSAEVTTQVQNAGAGTYTAGRIPATDSSTENNLNCAGWTLAVIYENNSLPARNMTIFVGAEVTTTSVTTTSTVTGFCTPQTGPINARMMVSAMEGDPGITGDQMRFGPTVASLTAVSGPNNPINNFFCSQINNNSGYLDTSGTFGDLNSTPGSTGNGVRQGWDITNIDVSAQMQNGQSTAYARGTTTGDYYTINSVGLQIDVGAPVFPLAVMSVNKATTYIGDILTYTINLDNTAGTANALNVVFTSVPPSNTNFISGSFTIGGVAQPGADPAAGVSLGTITAGSTVVITYQARVEAIPIAPATAQYQNSSTWTYQYQSCPAFPLNSGSITTNTVSVNTVRLVPTKTAVPPGHALPGDPVVYTISIPNTGTADTSGATLTDPIPVGTIYVLNSTTLNGVNVPDIVGAMPYAGGGLINSSGDPAGQIKIGKTATVTFRVTISPSPPSIITNVATIDPDGAGPAPPIEVAITNPPVEADLYVHITDHQTTAIPGEPITYEVTAGNNGPDSVISLTLSVTLPSMISSPIYTPSTGIYNSNTCLWTGLTLASGQSVTLTVTGSISSKARGTLTTTATVAPTPGVVDPNYDNNTDSDTNTLTPYADLAITKSNGQSSVQPGAQIIYTINVINIGPSSVTSVTVVDIVPYELLDPVFTWADGVYNTDTGGWTGIDLGPAQTIPLTLTGTLNPAVTSGTIVNSVTVSPPAGVIDPDPNNNHAVDTSTIGDALSLAKVANKSTAFPGEVITYTTTYKNMGTGNLQHIIISDDTPSYTTFLSAAYGSLPANLTGCVITHPNVGETGPILWTFSGNLVPGSTGTITFLVTIE